MVCSLENMRHSLQLIDAASRTHRILAPRDAYFVWHLDIAHRSMGHTINLNCPILGTKQAMRVNNIPRVHARNRHLEEVKRTEASGRRLAMNACTPGPQGWRRHPAFICAV